MKHKNTSCYRCEETKETSLENLYGYTVCNNCKSKLGLFQDATITRHIKSFAAAHQLDASHPSYKQDVQEKLALLEQQYISKKIKLLHIQERIKSLY